jgi:hypothetical protein
MSRLLDIWLPSRPGLNFESVVSFFANERINKNLPGRLGWLDRIRTGLIDHDGVPYLASYD